MISVFLPVLLWNTDHCLSFHCLLELFPLIIHFISVFNFSDLKIDEYYNDDSVIMYYFSLESITSDILTKVTMNTMYHCSIKKQTLASNLGSSKNPSGSLSAMDFGFSCSWFSSSLDLDVLGAMPLSKKSETHNKLFVDFLHYWSHSRQYIKCYHGEFYKHQIWATCTSTILQWVISK